MRILVDADACPVKELILREAKRRSLPVLMIHDTSHELFYPQIGVGKRLDGGRRRVKKYLWSF